MYLPDTCATIVGALQFEGGVCVCVSFFLRGTRRRFKEAVFAEVSGNRQIN